MLTGELRSKIDGVWNAFWAGGIANPLEVIEQITYLLFMRGLDEAHTREENKATRLKKLIERRIPDLPIVTNYHYTETGPVFFGHYWLQGTPIISNDYAACLDFSVAKEGFLTAYRWSGESVLSPNNIVYVSAVAD
jgi:hypothetical protein